MNHIYFWIKNDFKVNKFRFIIEVIAWLLSIGCAITMALTVPEPPLIIIYPLWILGCSMYAWAAWTRNSFGMLMNYLIMVCIDCIGLMRMLTI